MTYMYFTVFLCGHKQYLYDRPIYALSPQVIPTFDHQICNAGATDIVCNN